MEEDNNKDKLIIQFFFKIRINKIEKRKRIEFLSRVRNKVDMAISLSSATTTTRFQLPSASLVFLAGRRPISSINVTKPYSHSGLLHCPFVSSPTSLLSTSSFSGISLGVNLDMNKGLIKDPSRGLLVRAGKAALCLTKRSRSRKSLARTHGFRLRMRTTGGRAILKRRRAKGRHILCTKTNPNTGKR
ncbi:hypothetical protein MKW94_008910 [Papaver nudicaule]|uniref:Large ribosomal subunit protein bL34c n=1 Tax=Papaver nudicaule TaxID=74823 RepID=A0AA41VQ74_PAPNU|nr:hypothetical protein [Papaver nudicaule]